MITYEDIKAELDKAQPNLFRAANGLALHQGLPPDLSENSAGVWISVPLNQRDLQLATLNGSKGRVAVYDEEVTFAITFVTSKKNQNAKTARSAVEGLSTCDLFKNYYAKPFAAADVYNPSNIEVDYGFTFNKTVIA